jgi:hypothetical protein
MFPCPLVQRLLVDFEPSKSCENRIISQVVAPSRISKLPFGLHFLFVLSNCFLLYLPKPTFIPSSPDRANLPFRTAVRYMLGLQDVMQASCEISPTPLSANRNRTFRVPVSRPVLQFKVTKETEHENIHLPSSQHILVKFPAHFSSLL